MDYVKPVTDFLGLTTPASGEDGEDLPNPLGDPITINIDDQSK